VSANLRFPDKKILSEIERTLFIDVDRPLTAVNEATSVGDAMRKALDDRVQTAVKQ
jgi:hypothetical protein